MHVGNGPLEYRVYLNDLLGNDFNAIFRSLASFKDKLNQQMGDDVGHCFVNGVPGSFYSLHWLSQVLEEIEDNRGNIYIARSSPPNVLKAYYDQFEKDFLMFLRCRSEEVVAKGRMVLTFIGSNINNEQYNKESYHMWELLATVLNDMVFEGLIEEKKLNSFNIPQYSATAAELGVLVEKEGSFTVNQVHISEVSWEANEYDENSYDHYDFVKCVRSVAKLLLISHFGEAIIEELFERYKEVVQVSMAKEKTVFVNVTVSLTRKG